MFALLLFVIHRCCLLFAGCAVCFACVEFSCLSCVGVRLLVDATCVFVRVVCVCLLRGVVCCLLLFVV